MCEYTVEQAIAMALQHIRICAPDPVVDAALEAALLERQASAVTDEACDTYHTDAFDARYPITAPTAQASAV